MIDEKLLEKYYKGKLLCENHVKTIIRFIQKSEIKAKNTYLKIFLEKLIRIS